MAGRLRLELFAPGHVPMEVDAEEIILPGEAGILTVLPEHTPLLTRLAHGVIIALHGGGEHSFVAVHGGFAEVLGDTVTVLANLMEGGPEIDADRARQALERARKRLEKADEEVDVVRAKGSMTRAMIRLQASGGEEFKLY